MNKIHDNNYVKRSITRPLVKTALVFVSFAGSLTIAQGGGHDASAGAAVTGGYTFDRYSRTAEVWGYSNPVYKNWTTEQLQKRRLDLYAMVPLARTANEVPAYIYSGMPLPQQDEIKAIEVELNRRYQAGDKGAELREFWPSTRRHIASS